MAARWPPRFPGTWGVALPSACAPGVARDGRRRWPAACGVPGSRCEGASRAGTCERCGRRRRRCPRGPRLGGPAGTAPRRPPRGHGDTGALAFPALPGCPYWLAPGWPGRPPPGGASVQPGVPPLAFTPLQDPRRRQLSPPSWEVLSALPLSDRLVAGPPRCVSHPGGPQGREHFACSAPSWALRLLGTAPRRPLSLAGATFASPPGIKGKGAFRKLSLPFGRGGSGTPGRTWHLLPLPRRPSPGRSSCHPAATRPWQQMV